MSRRERALLAGICALHVALLCCAARAWIGGPFAGQGVVDGAEVLALAQQGSAGTFETKSPLYPWLLGRLLAWTGEVPWTVALSGTALSLANLLASAAIARRLAGSRGALVAAALYAASGSALVFAVQPLPVLLATALVAWGALLAGSARGAAGRGAGGALLAASVFARASLLPAAVAALGWALWRAGGEGSRARRAALAGGALAATLLLMGAFGARAWPAGGGLNLRLGNGPARSGLPDLRPGPRYDALRYESVFEQPADRALEDVDRFSVRLLARECAADPAGAAATVARKAWLCAQPVEVAASADFRHGLRGLALLPALLCSFALVVPLALAGLARRRDGLVWAPVLAVLLANVLFVTAARYRFPALPFLCAAGAGGALALAARERRALLVAGLGALVLWPGYARRGLVFPADGLVQEGFLHLARDGSAAAGIAALDRALDPQLGARRDPRAAYMRGLAHEKAARAADDSRVEQALDDYALALELEPRFPQALENQVALLLRAGRAAEARARAEVTLDDAPWAGGLRLMLAEEVEASGDAARARALRGEGHRILALRALAQNERQLAAQHAQEARRAGVVDARLPAP